MENLIISPEVVEKISRKVQELHQMCAENNVPVVACFVCKRVEDGDHIEVRKAISVFLDARTGAFESTIAAAHEILQLDKVPKLAIARLSALRMIRESSLADEAESGDVVTHQIH